VTPPGTDRSGSAGPEAFARRFLPVIRRVARRRLTDPDLVEEAISAVLLRHRQLVAVVADSADPEPLIVRATINACTDVLRRHRLWSTMVTPLEPEELARVADAPDATADPESAVLMAERNRALTDALGTVQDAELIVLRVDGYSYDELAALTGRSSVALRSAYARARRRVAAAYAAMLEERGLLGGLTRLPGRCLDRARRRVRRWAVSRCWPGEVVDAVAQRLDMTTLVAVAVVGLVAPAATPRQPVAAATVVHVVPAAMPEPATALRRTATARSAERAASLAPARSRAAVVDRTVSLGPAAASVTAAGDPQTGGTVGLIAADPAGGTTFGRDTGVPCAWASVSKAVPCQVSLGG
jgi:RNA polymerase sigma factor (sigma-70 family)